MPSFSFDSLANQQEWTMSKYLVTAAVAAVTIALVFRVQAIRTVIVGS